MIKYTDLKIGDVIYYHNGWETNNAPRIYTLTYLGLDQHEYMRFKSELDSVSKEITRSDRILENSFWSADEVLIADYKDRVSGYIFSIKNAEQAIINYKLEIAQLNDAIEPLKCKYPEHFV